MSTLGDDLPKQCARVRELIAIYRSLPNNAGAFGAHMMECDLQNADKAMISGDVVEMIRCYQKLKDCE
jgi:hypothetical protein